MDEILAVYLGAATIGLLHGVEPGHGWPVAAVYAVNRNRRYLSGLVTAGILSAAHLISSLAVVLVFLFLRPHLGFLSGSTLSAISGTLLLFFAIHMWRSSAHSHRHPEDEKTPVSLWQMATFAFILGFVHEEEIALLTLCLAGINCLALMLTYATAVTVAITCLTLSAVWAYEAVRQRFDALERHLPRLSAIFLAGLGALYLFKAL